MPKKKTHSIKIKSCEVELYRIFKDLEKYGRAAFSYPSNPIKQQELARTIGKRSKKANLVKNDLFYPTGNTRAATNVKQSRLNLVQLPIGVEVIEKKNGTFCFIRRFHTF